MKMCLAAMSTRKNFENEFYRCKFMLESFYSFPDWLMPYFKQADLALLDSGAFTYLNNAKKGQTVDFNKYLDTYIDFINKNDIKYFFELDIDSLVGIEEVERLRERLEKETDKKSIPVFHKARGKDYFLKMCDEYDYVAVGGIVTKEIKPFEHKYFKWFIDEAHKRNTKIHLLGYTNLKGIYDYRADSVDSTSWLSGGRFGTMYWFDGQILRQVDTGKRRRREDISHEPLDLYNYNQWLKLQQYLDKKI